MIDQDPEPEIEGRLARRCRSARWARRVADVNYFFRKF